jgi:NAD(P)-dependent dehydrogenase (short-subunit alcohol dehydrogenase family)
LDPEAFLKLGYASQHGRVVHTEALGGSAHRASTRDGKKVPNVIPVDHGAIPHRAVRLPKPVSNTSNSSTGADHSLRQRARLNSERRTPIVAAGVSRRSGSISHHRCARFRTQRTTPADLCGGSQGKIDILFASAGTGEAVPLGEITEQHFDATFGLNTRGTLFTVQKALPLFNDGGSIFMTGSVASLKGFPGYSVYAASKAALHAFARGWLNELKGRNIRVNVLHPGPIATPMQDQVLTEEAKRMFESLIPRGTMGRPEEIATAALFLASDDSSFVNGLELSVDGGFSAI